MEIKQLYENLSEYKNKNVTLEGWIRNHRKQKEFGFIDFSDGSFFKTIQVVYDNQLSKVDEIQKLHVGSAIKVSGLIVDSPASGQDFELQAILFY